ITFAGSFDRRELRREVSVLRALFNRSQVALATALPATVFHAFALLGSSVAVVIGAAIPSVLAGYVVNIALVSTAAHLDLGLPFRAILARLSIGGLPQFLVSYLGLGVFGAILAALHDRLGELTVVGLIVPLLLARHLYVRSQMLEKTTRELERSNAQMRMLQGLAGKLDGLM